MNEYVSKSLFFSIDNLESTYIARRFEVKLNVADLYAFDQVKHTLDNTSHSYFYSGQMNFLVLSFPPLYYLVFKLQVAFSFLFVLLFIW